jgi:hypothetical protein
LFFYDNAGPDTNICQKCLRQNYGREDEFFGYEDIWVCKDHNHCLVFATKIAKRKFDNDYEAHEEFELLKKTQDYPSEVEPQIEGNWLTQDEVFEQTVRENSFYAPEHINNN